MRLPIGRIRWRLVVRTARRLRVRPTSGGTAKRPRNSSVATTTTTEGPGMPRSWLDVCDIASPGVCPGAAAPTAAVVVVVLTGTFVVAVVLLPPAAPFPDAPPPAAAPPAAAAAAPARNHRRFPLPKPPGWQWLRRHRRSCW